MPTPDASQVCLEYKGRFAYARGLCIRCYHRLATHVRVGKTTWRELEAAGRARPPHRQPAVG